MMEICQLSFLILVSLRPILGSIFQDITGVLPDVQLQPTLPLQATSNASTETLVLDEGESSGRKRKLNQGIEETKTKQDERPKRRRSAATHNMSERARRRDRIKRKMRALQELIPNCNKSDSASMLDEAIEYIKAVKLHVQMMSTGGGALCQVPHMSPAGIQSTQIPHFSQHMDMLSRPGFGMGMVSTSYSTGLPMIPASLLYLYPLPSAAEGFCLISGSRFLPVPQLQVPLIASQACLQALPHPLCLHSLPGNWLPHSSQGESNSQSTLNNFQNCNQPGSSLTVPASHVNKTIRE